MGFRILLSRLRSSLGMYSGRELYYGYNLSYSVSYSMLELDEGDIGEFWMFSRWGIFSRMDEGGFSVILGLSGILVLRR